MSHHSRYEVDPLYPRAKAVCDRCGQLWNHYKLTWQYQWVGPRLQNLRFLVCPECYDKPQPNIRRIIIPPDPTPIMNARPENYVLDNNGTIQPSTGVTGQSSLVQRSGGLSAIGADANFFTPQYGNRIGSLTGAGGLNSAFDSNLNKQSWQSACNATISNSSFNNYVGINWQGAVNNLSMPSSLFPPIIQHTLTSVNLQAPSDRGFLSNSAATSYVIQSSPVDTIAFSAWTTISSGTTAGTAGESISVTITSTFTNPLSQFHRIAFQGDGVNYICVAQAQFAVAETGGNQ